MECRHKSCIPAALKGFSNGITYGIKVRFTHAIVIAILFGKGSAKRRLWSIFKNTSEHSLRLGTYVFIYKSILCALTKLRGMRSPLNSGVAGCLAGYIMFSKETQVNSQITFYLFSRVLVASAKLVYSKGYLGKVPALEKLSFAVLTTFCWGLVMYLFEKDKTCLQASLKNSMTFLYEDSETWSSWADFLPFGATIKNLLSN